MLIWMCALHCEAKPVIDAYRLKKSTHHHGYDIYLGDDMACVVSGIGAIQMAGATAWAAALHTSCNDIGWINLGVAGHIDLPLGTTIIAKQVISADNPAKIYPVPLFRHGFISLPIISLDNENTHYHKTAVYDMEAYAFMQIARRFSSLEFCQSIKVISDNADSAPHRDKSRISQLISDNMSSISAFATQMQDFIDTESSRNLGEPDLERFLSLAHFTRTQQIQLRKNLLALHQNNQDLDHCLNLLGTRQNSAKILSTLQSMLHQMSEQL